MTSSVLGSSQDEHTTEATNRGESIKAKKVPVKTIARRSLPIIRPRYLDVNEILKRSLPRLPSEAKDRSSPAID